MELTYMKTQKEKTILKLLSLTAAALLVFMIFTVFLLHTEEAVKQPSNVGLYMKDGDFSSKTVKAGEDDTIEFEMELVNYNASDDKNRIVLLYILPEVAHGDADNWAYRFKDAENAGLPYFRGDHPLFGTVDFYKYTVDANEANPTDVTFEVSHDYEKIVDNDDDSYYKILGLDYEVGTELLDKKPGETDAEARQRFFFKIIENGSEQNHNVTYLLDDGDLPNTEIDNALRLRAFVTRTPFEPICEPNKFFIDLVADEIYDELVISVRNDGSQDDNINLSAVLDHGSAESWNIRAEAPFVFKTYYAAGKDGAGGYQVKIFVSLDDPTDINKVPSPGTYNLKLIVESDKGGFTDEKTVEINLLQRYDPKINLNTSDSDDKIAKTDGPPTTPTTFNFRVKNNGTLTDTIALLAEVQNIGSRAGDTNDYWTKTFFPTSPLVDVAPGEIVDVMMNLTPTLNNELIPPGKYPVYVNATSTNNIARKDQAMVYIRMPSLYNPQADIVSEPIDAEIQVGTPGVYRFTVTNAGQVTDTFTLGFTVKDGDGTEVANEANLGDPAWTFLFENADTGATLENRQLTLATGASQDVLFKITPPAGAPIGDYDVEIIATSGGPAKQKATIPATFTLTLPNLWIDTEDIEIIPSPVDEGKDVTIKVTVHLDGAVNKTMKVEFHYHTAASGFTFIDEEDLDFGGKTGKDVTEVVEFVWKAKIPYAVENNIKVTIDATDVVVESDETDNEATATIKVNPIDKDEEEFPWIPVIGGAAVIIVVGILLLAYLGFLPFLFAWKNEFIVAELTVAPESPTVGEEADLKAVLLNEGKPLEAGEHEIMVSLFDEFDPIEELDVSQTTFERDEETELPAVKWTPKEAGERPITVVLEVDGEEVDEYTLNVVVGE